MAIPGNSNPNPSTSGADAEFGFIHRFVPGSGSGQAADLTLLLLHGTGSDENDLLPLGRRLAPGAALLSPRGKVLEHGMPRFFRRLAEGVFDQEDLVRRADELAQFVAQAANVYGFDPARVVAAGFSNGANIAAALLLLHPGTLAAAALLHPMVPLQPERAPDLSGVAVFAGAGRQDPLVRPAETERLVHLLQGYGADVTLSWQPGGHTLGPAEVEAARQWFADWQVRKG